jgi:hypothetical protein
VAHQIQLVAHYLSATTDEQAEPDRQLCRPFGNTQTSRAVTLSLTGKLVPLRLEDPPRSVCQLAPDPPNLGSISLELYQAED